MKKKLLTILLCGVFVLSATGCGEKETNENDNNTNTDDTTVDTSIKINLNDNIEVYEQLYSTLCGGWYFVTNAESVFPDGILTYDKYKVIDVGGIIAPHEWGDGFEKLTFDEAKESAAKIAFDKIDASNRLGIANYQSSFKNHEFYYEYYALELADSSKYPELANALETTLTDFQENFTPIFHEAGAYLKKGACGGASVIVTLTEELCETYHLNCDRW